MFYGNDETVVNLAVKFGTEFFFKQQYSGGKKGWKLFQRSVDRTIPSIAVDLLSSKFRINIQPVQLNSFQFSTEIKIFWSFSLIECTVHCTWHQTWKDVKLAWMFWCEWVSENKSSSNIGSNQFRSFSCLMSFIVEISKTIYTINPIFYQPFPLYNLHSLWEWKHCSKLQYFLKKLTTRYLSAYYADSAQFLLRKTEQPLALGRFGVFEK